MTVLVGHRVKIVLGDKFTPPRLGTVVHVTGMAGCMVLPDGVEHTRANMLHCLLFVSKIVEKCLFVVTTPPTPPVSSSGDDDKVIVTDLE